MWDAELDVVIAGAGGCGLTAALTASESNLEVGIFEKTEFVLGNTAASAGMIPAANTRFQKEVGIEDTVDIMTEDILRKNKYQSDKALTSALCNVSGPLVEWMSDSLNIPLSLVNEFTYPGHSFKRMHAPPSRSGLELMKALKREVARRSNLYLMLNSEVIELITDKAGAVIGVEVSTPGGKQKIKTKKVILATNGFGANKELVNQYIPEIASAQYFGYEANTGDAIRMAEKLNAATSNLTAYQGHSAVAESHGLLVTWGTIMLGGFMVNKAGERFGNETEGYSEFAVHLLNQNKQVGYIIFDQEIHDELLSIEDFKTLHEMNAFKSSNTVEELAKKLEIKGESLFSTLKEFHYAVEEGKDKFGRVQFPKKLNPPYYSIKVSPALFHTQGGLLINENAQVISKDERIIPNLYAGGGAAVGVSGKHAYGYMSGNGLLAAMGFGRIAGEHAKQTILVERAIS